LKNWGEKGIIKEIMEEFTERRNKVSLERGWHNRQAYWEARAEEDARRVEAGKVDLREVLLGYAKTLAEKEAREGVDFLTGLFTKRVFEEDVSYWVPLCNHLKIPLGVLYIDIDKFKEEINDKHGHLAGDKALKAFAKTLLNNIGHFDLPARVGGEEFAVLLFRGRRETLNETGEKIRKETESLIIEDIPNLKMTISIGGAMLREEDTPETLIKRVDTALYQAKSEGRNKVVVVE